MGRSKHICPAVSARSPITNFEVRRIQGGKAQNTFDETVTEEPLETRVYFYDKSGKLRKEKVAITMRTPGNDFELAAGFLYSEGVVSGKDEITRISYCRDPNEEQKYNIVNVYLSEGVAFDPSKLSRHIYINSSCGVCGKASLEALHIRGCPVLPDGPLRIDSSMIPELPKKLRDAQKVFTKTGGLHASGLFAPDGGLLSLKEDVGRHNALDKLVGSELLAGKLPISDKVCVVSGRIGFEIVQKAVVAGIPMIVAVGAASSLAVEMAREFHMTLIGFVRDTSFNIYSGSSRVIQG